MAKIHRYEIATRWSGNQGQGTQGYTSYKRDYVATGVGKPPIFGSSDPTFRGDSSRYNPEDLLVASLSACHMLWYLHLCSSNGLVVHAYEDVAVGKMEETDDGSGRFAEVELRPTVTFSGEFESEVAERLHHEAHSFCFIANSVNFEVRVKPRSLGSS